LESVIACERESTARERGSAGRRGWPAKIRYYLGGRCAAFTAVVGVDDSQAAPRGSVSYTVLADGVVKAETPVLRGADPAHELSADVRGARFVELVAGDGGDGIGNDHADWGDALFRCG
ncbi:NPCBM/NEW2 domain-containing protein, partial [Nonomuraea sp. NPDC055795]